MIIHIIGASGSGTTTLGRTLAQALSCSHLDADDYYWVPTEPPFQQKVPLPERNANITRDLEAAGDAVLSGSMVSWGEQWLEAFDLVIFLWIPAELRLARLRRREEERYGPQQDWDATTRTNSEAFLEWAAHYDDSDFRGRSRVIHRQWMAQLNCPVLRIEGDTSVDERLQRSLQMIENINKGRP